MAGLVLLGVIGLVGVGWYYSGEILNVADEEPPVYDTAVQEVDDASAVLAGSPAARKPGTSGLDFPDGYAQVGEVEETDTGLERPLTPLHGELALSSNVRLDGYAYPPQPEHGLDFPVETAEVITPLGSQPAWHVDGADDRWAIFVHGRGGGRQECFRLLPLYTELDWSSLCVSYRNDPGTPADPQGIYRQGATEWEDVEAAVQFALDHGAEDVVLVGYSMGGQITANFLRRSELAGHARGVICDAPLLEWGPYWRRRPGIARCPSRWCRSA